MRSASYQRWTLTLFFLLRNRYSRYSEKVHSASHHCYEGLPFLGRGRNRGGGQRVFTYQNKQTQNTFVKRQYLRYFSFALFLGLCAVFRLLCCRAFILATSCSAINTNKKLECPPLLFIYWQYKITRSTHHDNLDFYPDCLHKIQIEKSFVPSVKNVISIKLRIWSLQ